MSKTEEKGLMCKDNVVVQTNWGGRFWWACSCRGGGPDVSDTHVHRLSIEEKTSKGDL